MFFLTFPKVDGTDLRARFVVLLLMSLAMQLAFATWWTLLNNFAVEAVGASGFEFGIQQSIREIPGFLAFLVVYLLLFIREQKLALIALALLGFGVAITGYFTSFIGFYITTLIMSLGFHYYETVHQSMSLQWLPVKQAPALLGTIAGVTGVAQLAAYVLVFIGAQAFDLSFATTFLIGGSLSLALVIYITLRFPMFPEKVEQSRKLVVKRRYWLFYLLTFMSGARRQIFVVFAGFLMVERFGFDLHEIAALYFINGAFNLAFLPLIGGLIGRFGERLALIIEYIGLTVIFIGYAYVADITLAIVLYLMDHAFFAIAIALKTYFQKIADPEDMAPTAGVAFTINHIAAVFIPVMLGAVWLYDPSLVFLTGAGIAIVSLLLSLLVPRNPSKGHETVFHQLNFGTRTI